MQVGTGLFWNITVPPAAVLRISGAIPLWRAACARRPYISCLFRIKLCGSGSSAVYRKEKKDPSENLACRIQCLTAGVGICGNDGSAAGCADKKRNAPGQSRNMKSVCFLKIRHDAPEAEVRAIQWIARAFLQKKTTVNSGGYDFPICAVCGGNIDGTFAGGEVLTDGSVLAAEQAVCDLHNSKRPEQRLIENRWPRPTPLAPSGQFTLPRLRAQSFVAISPPVFSDSVYRRLETAPCLWRGAALPLA